jgi:hypothetical protein
LPPPPPPPPPPPVPTITLTTGELLIAKTLTIQGPGAGLLNIVGSGTRAFEMAPGTTVGLNGMAIGGSSSYWTGSGTSLGFGGAILNHGTLTLGACTITGSIYSTIGRGGGIFNDGTVNVIGCTVSNCYAEGSQGGDVNADAASGAGIANFGTATLTNTMILNNRATETTSYPWFNKGGGIYNEGALALNGCTVSGNYAQRDGGGIFNAGTMILSSTSLSGNLSGNGTGGIENDGTATIKNSSHIDAVYNPGTLFLESGSVIDALSGNPAMVI